MFDCAYFALYNTLEEACNLHLYEIFSATVFFSSEPAYQLYSLKLIDVSSTVLFRFLFMMTFMINACLCLDLFLAVKSPFYPAGRRSKFYLITSALITLPVCIFEGVTFDSLNRVNGWADYATISIFSIFLGIAVFSIIFAIKRISRPGVSQEVRN